MIRWDAVGYGLLAALVVSTLAWLSVGFVAGIGIVGSSGLVAGAVTGWLTNPETAGDWRAGGYHGMLAGGLAGILVVTSAAAVAFGTSSVVLDAAPGAWRTAASIVASPLGVPLFTLEGIAAGSASGAARFQLSQRR